jgi:hypothetical protein
LSPRSLRTAIVAALFFAVAGSTYAAHPYAVSDDVFGALRRARAGEKVVLDRVPLVNGDPYRIELRPFTVWAPDATIVIHDGAKETVRRPDATRFYAGSLDGDPESLVTFAVSPDGEIRGSAMAGGHHIEIARARRIGGLIQHDVELAPMMAIDSEDRDATEEPPQGFACGVEKSAIFSPLHHSLKTDAQNSPGGELPSTSTAYAFRLIVETDFELFNGFGGNSTTLSNYIADLVLKSNIIYQRDLKTTLVLGTLHIQTTAADPWTVDPAAGGSTDQALAQLGSYYHNTYPVASNPRSAVVMVSGKPFNGGIAWIGTMCDTDFSCGASGSQCGSSTYANAWAGHYAFCGSSSGTIPTTVADPTLPQNGVQFGFPSAVSSSLYWILSEFTHELGHVVNGEHTHCVALTAADQAQYGVTRGFVDNCYAGECYSGPTSVPAEKGTIMSYCHLLFSGNGFPQSRYVFWQAGEASEQEWLDYIQPGLEFATPNGAISVGGASVTCAAGRPASVASAAGLTYSWSIGGGTITSATNTASITFTPASPNVTLTVTVTNTNGCGITSQRVVPTACAGLTAPANVIATATAPTSVNVTWSASAGATQYEVSRTANNTTYSVVGSTATTTLTDNTATGGTAYLYRVRAQDAGSTFSGYSTTDLATTVLFTDPSPTAQVTPIRAVHLTELRTAVNAVRVLGGLGATSFVDPTLSGTVQIKAIHMTALRTALDAARAALTLSALSYTDSTLTSATSVKLAHLTELRNGVR